MRTQHTETGDDMPTYEETMAVKPQCCQGRTFADSCETHVGCDSNCLALLHPGDDTGEVLRALEHWEHHGHLGGCSHAR